MQKGQRKKKRMNVAALEERSKLTVASMPQHWRPNATTLGKRQKHENWQNGGCCSIEYPMSQHAWTRGKIENPMPQHWAVGAAALVPEAEKIKSLIFIRLLLYIVFFKEILLS